MRTLASIFFVVFSLAVSAPAMAQSQVSIEQTAAQSEVDQQQTSIKKPFIITPSGTIELPNGTTTHLKAAIIEPPEGLRNSVNGVLLNGYIGYVPYEGKNLMVTVIDTVSKGDNTVAIPRRIEAQEYRNKTVLSDTDEINVEVDPAELDSALDELANMAKEKQEAGGEDDQQQNTPSSPASTPTAGGTTGTGTNGTGASGEYQNPSQQDFDGDPLVEVKTTTDGCEVRIDQNQRVAIQQNKTQTYEDGKLQSETQCIDSEIRYPLQDSFDGCQDIVDVNALTAYRQSQTYYSKNGARVTVSSCAKDTSATYKITEDVEICAPVVNRASQEVTIYAKLVYTGANNAVISVRGCSPSTTQPAYPLEQSYDSCTHRVDVPNRFAYARYEDYYVNNVGTRVEVSDCTIDEQKKWPISEREGTCKVYLDFTVGAETAFKQSVLEYTDDQGVLNEARGCDKSELTAGVPMVKDTNLCAIQHDFDNEESYQMFMWTYTLDGVPFQASACGKTDVVYDHDRYTVDASGAKICSPNINTTDRLVTLFYRTGIVVNENVQYINECTPDSENTLDVFATTDGCTDPVAWQHDLAAAISYENERWYYAYNGVREYVTPCQQGSNTYPHLVTTIGWQLHDDQLYALPISRVTINAPIGEYVVSLNAVIPGAAQQPYVLQETQDILPEESNIPNSYEGCTGIYNTDRTEIYHRPDNTPFNKVVGIGEPVSNDICATEVLRRSLVKAVRDGSYTQCQTGIKGSGDIPGTSDNNGDPHYTRYQSFMIDYTDYARTIKTNPYTSEVVSDVITSEERSEGAYYNGSTRYLGYLCPYNAKVRSRPTVQTEADLVW